MIDPRHYFTGLEIRYKININTSSIDGYYISYKIDTIEIGQSSACVCIINIT